MKKILFFLSLLFISSGLSAKENPVHTTGYPYYAELPDSIPSLYDMFKYLDSDIEKAKWVLDIYLNMESDSRRKLYTDVQVNQAYADYFFTTGHYSESIQVSEEVIKDPLAAENDTTYMLILDQIMESYRMINDFDGTMKYALMMLEAAKKVDNKSQIGRAYLFMGKTQYRVGDRAEGVRYFNLAEEYFIAGNDFHWLSNFYLTLANIYLEHREYEHAHHYTILYVNSLTELEELYSHQNELFIEIYKGRAYVMMADILLRLGKAEEAAGYYDKFLETWNATDAREGIFIVPYLLAAERHSEAKKFVLRHEDYIRHSGDTINSTMLNNKYYLYSIYEKEDDLRKSLDYLKQVKALTDSLRKREQLSSALELAAVYEAAEKEAVIAAQKEKLRIRGIYIVTAIIISIILIGILILIIYFNRVLNRKNRILVTRIRFQHQKLQKPAATNIPNQIQDTEPAKESYRKRQDKELFAAFESLMLTEKLYLNNDLKRDDIVYRLGTNKNYLIQAIQDSTGMNFTDYVNSLRLEASLDLLDKSNEIISSVAEKCGFKSASHYHRLFIIKYGVSPNTYRKLSRE